MQIAGAGDDDGHEDECRMFDIEQDEQGKEVSGWQLWCEHRVSSTNHPHECGEGEHGAVHPEAIQPDEQRIQPAEMKRQGSVDGEPDLGVEECEDEVTGLEGEHEDAQSLHRSHVAL